MSGRRSEGPLLALVVLALILAVLGLIVAAAVSSGPIRGMALILLGAGAIAARQAIADVLSGITRPTPPEWYRAVASVMVGIIGVAVVGYGVAAIF